MIGIDYILFWLFQGSGRFLIGFVLGAFSYAVFTKIFHRSDGIFLVDDSDEEKTRWTLRYNSDPNDILKKRFVRFEVHLDK